MSNKLACASLRVERAQSCAQVESSTALMSRLSKLLHSYKNLVWLARNKTPQIRNTTPWREFKLPPLKPSTKLGLLLAGGTVLPFFLPATTKESPEKYERTNNWKDYLLLPVKPIINATHYPAVVALVAANIIISRALRSVRLLPISNLLFCISPSHVKMGLKACFIGVGFLLPLHSLFDEWKDMYLLCAFGPEVIDKYGNSAFLILYFGGALAGSLVHTLSLFRTDLMMEKIIGATAAVFSVMSANFWTSRESFLWIPAWVWFPFPILFLEFLLVKTKQLNVAWEMHVAGCLLGITAGQCLRTPARWQFSGKGEITLNTDGDKYEGEITNGLPTGKGKITSNYFPPYPEKKRSGMTV